MTWNHRIVKRTFRHGDEVEDQYGIYEAFYNEKDEVFAISKEPDGISAESLDGIYKMVGWLNDLVKKTKEGLPVLDYETIGGKGELAGWDTD